ncbi:hypothetical protein B0A48_15342 [Cryoendolithus antarcticus]|uniref:Uncharacterized protein n=1 Tax=Cryoendolithus antarcticus TaxID=1507870 RepID=A0A1V8SHR1_9PEZI|nr:hypothetical protein B0A48_15342 [Cryoendolithus antarcticus]
MVSENNLDLTGVGDRMATEMKDALKDLKTDNDKGLTNIGDCIASEVKGAITEHRLPRDSIPTADDIGKSIGQVIAKYLKEHKTSIDQSVKAMQSELLAKTSRPTQAYDKLSVAIELLTAKLADAKKNEDAGLDATSLREMILMHATCLWKMTGEGIMPEMHIIMSGCPGGKTKASVVSYDYRDVVKKCSDCPDFKPGWCQGSKSDHVHTYRQACQTNVLDGPAQFSDLDALRALYTKMKGIITYKSKDENIIKIVQ